MSWGPGETEGVIDGVSTGVGILVSVPWPRFNFTTLLLTLVSSPNVTPDVSWPLGTSYPFHVRMSSHVSTLEFHLSPQVFTTLVSCLSDLWSDTPAPTDGTCDGTQTRNGNTSRLYPTSSPTPTEFPVHPTRPPFSDSNLCHYQNLIDFQTISLPG